MKKLTPRIRSIIALAVLATMSLPLSVLAETDGYKFVDYPYRLAFFMKMNPDGKFVSSVVNADGKTVLVSADELAPRRKRKKRTDR